MSIILEIIIIYSSVLCMFGLGWMVQMPAPNVLASALAYMQGFGLAIIPLLSWWFNADIHEYLSVWYHIGLWPALFAFVALLPVYGLRDIDHDASFWFVAAMAAIPLFTFGGLYTIAWSVGVESTITYAQMANVISAIYAGHAAAFGSLETDVIATAVAALGGVALAVWQDNCYYTAAVREDAIKA